MKAYGRCSMCMENSKIMSITKNGIYYCDTCTNRYSQETRELFDSNPKEDSIIRSLHARGLLNEKYEDIRDSIPKYEDLD